MASTSFPIRMLAGAALLVAAPWAASAQEQAPAEAEAPAVNLLDAMRDGTVSVKAEGIGDGRMTVSVTNNTKRRVNVVLPPGIVASGAAGQMMGGMGGMGMGGGMGGMGGMGGGMGGMGGMGGGMGGMGGMGGGMGGGGMGMGGGTMPPMMGMMMLARLIMQLCGDYDSWDQRALASGMGGMGGMGMGGGMGGMGGGMGGMGMGMRSVPPTGLPFASLKPGQTRNLPTRLVSLNQPQNGQRWSPAKGEKLTLGDIGQVSDDPMVQKALKRLAAEKAPETVSQMVMWRVASGMEWNEIAQHAEKWGNSYELTLAQDFVDRLGSLPNDETGEILFQVDAVDSQSEAMAAALTKAIKDKPMLGLWAREGVPAEPTGPSVSFRVRLEGDEATVLVNSSNSSAQAWVPFGKFTMPVEQTDGQLDVEKFADGLAEGVLNRLVRAQLSRGPRVQGKLTHKIRIDNASPLILNGLSIVGVEKEEKPNELAGIGIPPRRSMTVPATDDVVRELGLRKGIRVFAADLSGL